MRRINPRKACVIKSFVRHTFSKARPAVLFGLVVTSSVATATDITEFHPGENLSRTAEYLASVDGKPGVSGFSFVVEFTAKDGYEGPVVSKPGVFSLDVAGAAGNRTYSLKMFGDNRYCSLTETDFSKLVASGESVVGEVERVAGVLTYFVDKAQSREGYVVVLYLNGERIGMRGAHHFHPEQNIRKPLEFASEVAVKSVRLASRSCSASELFPDYSRTMVSGNWNDAGTKTWVTEQQGVKFIDNGRLVLAISEKEVAGSPVLGGWDAVTGNALFGADGLGWELELGQSDGLSLRMRSNSRRIRSRAKFRGDGFTITSTGDGIEVRYDVKVDDCRIEQTLEAIDRCGSRIRGVVFPKAKIVRLPGDDAIVVPRFCGRESKHPTDGFSMTGTYPEDRATMQFVGYYDDRGNGIYFAAEDPKAVTKSYFAEGVGGTLTLGYFVNAPQDDGAKGTRRFTPSGHGVLELYKGGWFEAGQVYRKFLRKSAPWYIADLPRRDSPEWFMENPLWIVNLDLARKEHKVAMWYLRQYFDVRTSFVTSGQHSPDGYGWFGPNYAAIPGVKEWFADLRKDDIRFVIYTNPRLWYAGPHAEKSNNYSKTGKLWSLKDENGKQYMEFYGKGEEGHYVMPCPAVAEWRDFLGKRTRTLAVEAGVDGIYHDQMSCATPHVCYDSGHGHKVGDPSEWMSLGYWKLFDYLMGDLRRELPELIHNSEDTSEPYIKGLDGALHWRSAFPGHVPLFQSLYSPRIQFVGRGCDCHRCPGTYEAFFPKFAEQLCYGEQIGWVSYRNVFFPSPRRGYLKKLAHCRAALARFMNSSEMEAPLSFAVRPEEFRTDWGLMEYNPVTVNKVLTSVWCHKDGCRLVMFLNTVNEPQEVQPIWTRGGRTFTVCREADQLPETLTAAPGRVKVAPYGFEFWFVGDGAAPSEAERLASVLAKSTEFLLKDRGAMLSLKPTFDKKVENDATEEKPVEAQNAAWGMLAYIPAYNMLDCARTSELKGGWVAVMDNGLVNYGTVNFGEGAKSMMLTLATDEPNVKIEFFDITGDVPVRKIAEFMPEAGDWHGYHTCTSPLLGEFKGKRDVICRVTGGICNLKEWKLLRNGTLRPAVQQGGALLGKIEFSNVKPWKLFDGVYQYLGEIDVSDGMTGIELEIADVRTETELTLFDVTEYAPAVPLARFKVTKGRTKARMLYKVEGRRNLVLIASDGGTVVTGCRAVQ